jgi:hypothetical protein
MIEMEPEIENTMTIMLMRLWKIMRLKRLTMRDREDLMTTITLMGKISKIIWKGTNKIYMLKLIVNLCRDYDARPDLDHYEAEGIDDNEYAMIS